MGGVRGRWDSLLVRRDADLDDRVLVRSFLGGQTIQQLLPLSAEVASTRTVVLLRKTLRQIAARANILAPLKEQAAVLNTALEQPPV